MTTAPQRLLNVVFLLLTPIPFIAALGFFLEFDGRDRVYTPLVALLGCAPIAALAGINYVIYRKFTVWHSSDDSAVPRKRQVLLTFIPACVTFIYAVSVMIFYWRDTRSLHLECKITKADNAKDVGASYVFGVRHLRPLGMRSSGNYWAFEGRGWMAETPTELGIAIWNFDAASWQGLLSPLEYHPNLNWTSKRGGGLVLLEDKIISRGSRLKAEEALQSEVVELNYEYFDRLIISRQTGSFVMQGGYEGFCHETQEPTAAKPSAWVKNKF